jgi:hypothetical protein
MKISPEVRKELDKAVKLLGDEKSSFIADVKQGTSQYLANSTPKICLTIIENKKYSDTTHYPEVGLTYFSVLKDFCFGGRHDGHSLDSALTDPIINIVVEIYQKLFSDNADALSKALTAAVAKDQAFAKALRESLEDSLRGTIPATTKDLIMENGTREIISHTQNALQSQTMSSAMDVVGTTVAKVAGSAISTPIVAKIAVTLAHNLAATLAVQVKAVVAKLLASGALKTILVGKLKTVLAGTLLVGIAQTISAKLAAAGIAVGPGAAIAVIIIPALAWFMRHEYKSLPKKLSNKVPSKVADELSGQYNSVNLTVVEHVYESLIATGAGVALKSALKTAIPIDELGQVS